MIRALLGYICTESEAAEEAEEPEPAEIPLRFWIALWLSVTIVLLLALLGVTYGVFLTQELRSWADRTEGSITSAREFVLEVRIPLKASI